MLSQITLGIMALGIAHPVMSLGSEGHGEGNGHGGGGHHRNVLRVGSPESVGLLSEPLEELVFNMTGYTHAANYSSYTDNKILPIEPGSVNIVGHHGTIVSHFAVGHSNLYADMNGTHLPHSKIEDAHRDTIYDMASLTKIFTTIAALREVDSKRISLDKTVASYIPEFGVNGKDNVTIQMLLTHTTGMAADPIPGFASSKYTSREQRIKAILTQTPINPPGSTYVYSDLGYMTLMLVLEKVTGKRLDEIIGDYTTRLGMKDTFFNRGNVEGPDFPYYSRMAAQEFQIDVLGPEEPQRPQPVRGSVHDENAWALGGVSGHAGMFSTAYDTAIFCQMILNKGIYGGERILKPKTVAMLFHNFNEDIPGADARAFGFELNKIATAGPMASASTASHTGFTGTTMVIDPDSNTFYIHHANRAHPDRNWSSNSISRQAIGYWVAKSLGRDVEFPPLD